MGATGEPLRGDVRGFPDCELGRAVPYGIYDVAANTGWINEGADDDTAAFAVESIRRWWQGAGRAACPTAGRPGVEASAAGEATGEREGRCRGFRGIGQGRC